MVQKLDQSEIFYQLARLGLSGHPEDVDLFLRRLIRRQGGEWPDLTKRLTELVHGSPTRSSPLRHVPSPVPTPMPVDEDSRLELLRREEIPFLDTVPVFRQEVQMALDQVVEERCNQSRLVCAGLNPTRTVLLTGPPGVGKSLAARWMAWSLQLPLLTLDLAAVMSSLLGRTGNNLRHVLDHAKTIPCILFLDEFDAIAKRRNDDSEVGELKRLVTVLLQEIDNWPPRGLLLAATNHSTLLDPAVWRRFEVRIEFPAPDLAEATLAINRLLVGELEESDPLLKILASTFEGASYAEIERTLLLARRRAIMSEQPTRGVLAEVVARALGGLDRRRRAQAAAHYVEAGFGSERDVAALTGVSRATLHKHINPQSRLDDAASKPGRRTKQSAAVNEVAKP